MPSRYRSCEEGPTGAPGAFVLILALSVPAAARAEPLLRPDAAGAGSTESVEVLVTGRDRYTAGSTFDLTLPDGSESTATVTESEVIATAVEPAMQITENDSRLLSFDDGTGTLEVFFENDAAVALSLLRHDETRLEYRVTTLDATGRGVWQAADPQALMCIDMPVASPQDIEEIPLIDVEAIPSYYEVAALQSRPYHTEDKVLYIDFGGGVVDNTRWNAQYTGGAPISYEPFRSDGEDRTTPRGRYMMYTAWLEVVEDFAPFSVNVTTDRAVYLNYPDAKKSRIIVTPTRAWYPTFSGGVATLDGFGGNGHAATGWVWNLTLASMGQTISHEAGHQMGLRHDGDAAGQYHGGSGIWGPIMGSPFGKRYVQWSNGTYPGATNAENDLAILSATLGQHPDRAGGTVETALFIGSPNRYQDGSPILETLRPRGLGADVDVYRFTVREPSKVRVNVLPLPALESEFGYGNGAYDITLATVDGAQLSAVRTDELSPLTPTSNVFRFDDHLARGDYVVSVAARSPDLDFLTGFGDYGNGGSYAIDLDVVPIQTPYFVTPTPDTPLTGDRQDIVWSDAGRSVDRWWLYAGDGPDDNSYHDSGALPAGTTTARLSGLPIDGSRVHVTLYHQVAGEGWKSTVSAFDAARMAPPSLVAPDNGGILSVTDRAFTWDGGDVTPDSFWLTVGASAGEADYHSSGELNGFTYSTFVSGLPQDGSVVHATLWYRLRPGGRWFASSAQLQASFDPDAAPRAPVGLSPTGSVVSTAPRYAWTALPNASWYWLWVDDTEGNLIKRWYRAREAGCAGLATECSVSPTERIRGDGRWWVKGWNTAGGGGRWSRAREFTPPR